MKKDAGERATLQLPAAALRSRSRSHNDVLSETNLWSGSDERPRCSSTSIHDRLRPRSPSPSPLPGAVSRISVILGEDGHATEYLARSMLQLSSIPLLQPPALVPILVEHPPTGGDHYGPPFRVVINASYLNAGSSGNVSTKSAPSTPQGEWSAGGGVGSPQTPTPSSSPTPPKSPGRADKADRNVKQLSVSAPAMTQAPPPQKGGDPPSDAGTPLVPPLTPTPDEPGSSKSRQKKFHRHFKQVAQEERVLNYYSCALVADILLQGQLYITKNYFAFYSNVFGYVTKLLIPTCSVLKISKEKTARIIPNAVGVTTESERHVFGSLLSRDATYKLMMEVWNVAMGPEPLAMLPIKDLADDVDGGTFINLHHEGYESSLSGSERSVALTPSLTDKQQTTLCLKKELPNGNATTSVKHESAQHNEKPLSSRPPTLLLVSTALLVFLFVSAAFLLYRISMIQTQFSDNPLLSGSDQVYQEIIKWQAQLHSRSANEVQEFLNSNLDQLSKVRKSLEALSQLLLQNEEYARTTRDRQQNYDTSFLRKGNS